MGSNVTVSPHEFKPLRRFFNRGRCQRCYVHEHAHPVGGWANARPLGDNRLPRQYFAATPKPVVEEDKR